MLGFKHITNLGEDEADINLYSTIQDSQSFINDFNYLDSLGLKRINVNINSMGGSVFEGFGMIAAIKNAKTNVRTINSGVAASMAGLILIAGKEREAMDYSQVMVHDPSFSGRKAENQKEENFIKRIKSSLMSLFTGNTKVKEGEIDSMMLNETWLSAEEALEKGFIDKVISSGRNVSSNLSPEDLHTLVVNNFEKPNIKKMENLINHFQLEDNASENDVLSKIKELENVNTQLTNDLNTETEAKEAAEAKVAELENDANDNEALKTENENLNNTVAEMTVQNDIDAGKFDAKDKENLVKQAKNDLEGYKSIANSIPTEGRQTISEVLNQLKNGVNGGSTKTEGKTLRELEKEDPSLVEDLLENNIEEYKRLYKEEYGTEYQA